MQQESEEGAKRECVVQMLVDKNMRGSLSGNKIQLELFLYTQVSVSEEALRLK